MDRQQYLEIQALYLVSFIFAVNCAFAFIVAYAFHGEIPSYILGDALGALGLLSLAVLGLGLGLVTVTKLDVFNRTDRLISKYLWKQKYRGRLLGILKIR